MSPVLPEHIYTKNSVSDVWGLHLEAILRTQHGSKRIRFPGQRNVQISKEEKGRKIQRLSGDLEGCLLGICFKYNLCWSQEYIFLSGAQNTSAWLDPLAQELASDRGPARDQAAVRMQCEFKAGWLFSRWRYCPFSSSRFLGNFLRSFLSNWLPQGFPLKRIIFILLNKIAKGDKLSQGKGSYK